MNIYSKTLEANDLTYTLDGKAVFQNVNFSVQEGQALILHGPNGSGKSTLLKIAAGFIPKGSYEGSISMTSLPIFGDRPLLQINPEVAYVGPNPLFNPELTALENLNYWAFLNSQPKVEEQVFQVFNITEFKDVPIKFLSTGQQKRVSLSYLLINFKPIWLLDEPALGLDSSSLEILEAVLSAHLKSGGQAIVASHTNIKVKAQFLKLI